MPTRRKCRQRAFVAMVGMVATCYVVIGIMFIQQSDNKKPVGDGAMGPIYEKENNKSIKKFYANGGARIGVIHNGFFTSSASSQSEHSVSRQLSKLSHSFGLESLEKIPSLDIGGETMVCIRDCIKVQRLLETWPVSKPKAAIYYLTQSTRLNQLKSSLDMLEKNFNRQLNYPIIIFHEAEFRPVIDVVKNFTGCPIFFEEVEMKTPDFLTKPIKRNIECLSSISYRHMCRFHSKLVYNRAIIKNFDYLLRLDDESLILRPVGYDVFKFMLSSEIEYGHIWQHFDATVCVKGLWEATAVFINATGIKAEYFPEWKSPSLFYNNFELSKTSLWKTPTYQSYLNYLDQLGGFYYNRWGDAPIKGLALSIMIPRNKIHHFSDISYNHNTFTTP